MEKANSKIISLSFVAGAAILGFIIHVLFSAAAASVGGFVLRIYDRDEYRHGLPVVVSLVVFCYLQFNSRIQKWADEVVTEIRKIVWPTRKDTVALTIVVCFMLIFTGVVVGTYDLLSGYVINLIIKLGNFVRV